MLAALAATPAIAGGANPVVWLVWVSLGLPVAGAFAGAGCAERRGFAVSIGLLLAWLLPMWLAAESAQRGTALAAALGLWGIGLALGTALRSRGPLGAAGAALALALVLSGAPAGFWCTPAAPWSAGTTAALLRLDPQAWLLPAAGVDFLRLEAIYEPVGADRIGPDLWNAWGNLAGWGALVVGCLLALLARPGRRKAAAA
ncbi:MAG: hypothetical protein R3E96_13230 [Planctomycetota bacterium]